MSRPGSLDSVELKIEVKLGGQDQYQELAASVSGGTANLRPLEYSIDTTNLSDPHALYLPVPVLGDSARISAKGTGTATDSSLAIFAAVGRT